MASLHDLSLVLFLLLVAHSCMALASTIDDRCDYFSAGDQASYDYCEKTLQADRASATADERGLAAIAARIARATAKATGAKIARQQGVETVPSRRDGLAKCAAEYSAAVRRLGRAARDARRGGARELREAQTLLTEVTGVAARCDGALAAAGQGSSPLDAVDRGLDDLVGLALGILPLPPPPTARTRS